MTVERFNQRRRLTPTLRQIEIADTVFKLGSQKRAARELGISPSTIKNTIHLDNDNYKSLSRRLDRYTVTGMIGELISTAAIRLDEEDEIDYSESLGTLSLREVEVFIALTAPHNLDREIADLAQEAYIGESTLKNYATRIHNKLSTRSRFELIRVSLGLPLVREEDDIIDG